MLSQTIHSLSLTVNECCVCLGKHGTFVQQLKQLLNRFKNRGELNITT